MIRIVIQSFKSKASTLLRDFITFNSEVKVKEITLRATIEYNLCTFLYITS